MIIALKGVKRDLKYWVCMNNGRPIIGAKKAAAEFYGDVVDNALRQIATLFPGVEIFAIDHAVDLRKKKKSVEKIKPKKVKRWTAS